MSVFVYFVEEGRPVIADRFLGVAWEWSEGSWCLAPHLVEMSYEVSALMEADAFAEAYPIAALELLISPEGPSHP